MLVNVTDSNNKIGIKVTADGTKEAADGLHKVADALERNKTIEKSLGDAGAQSAYLSRLASYRDEATKLNQQHEAAAVSFTRFTGAVNDNAKAFGSYGDTIKQNSARFAEFGNQVSQAFNTLSPAVGEFQQVLDPALRSMSGLLGIIGGAGGAGIVAGGAVALITALGAAFSQSAKEAEDLAKQTEKNAAAMGDYLHQIATLRSEISGARQVRGGEAALQKRLAAGGGTADEYATETVAQKAAVRGKYTADALSAARKSGGDDAVTKMLDQQERELRAIDAAADKLRSYASANAANARDKAELDAALSTESPLVGKDVTGKKKKPVDSYTLDQANRESIRKISEIQQADEIAKAELKDAFRRDDIAASERAETEKRHEWLKSFEEQQKNEAFIFAMKEKGFVAEKAQRAAVNQAVSATGQIASAATAKMITAAVEGQKISGKAILRGIGESMIAEGTRATFTGAIQLATYQPQGAVTLATGLAEIAAGSALAGAAGSAGGAGGGGGSGSSSGAGGQGPVRGGNADSSQGGNTYITYVEFPTVTSPTAEDGLRVRQAIGAAERTYGPQV